MKPVLNNHLKYDPVQTATELTDHVNKFYCTRKHSSNDLNITPCE